MSVSSHQCHLMPGWMVAVGLAVHVVGCAGGPGPTGTEAVEGDGYRDAILYYQQEHEARPGDAHVVRNLGFAQLKSGQYPQAERSLRQARMFDWEDGATVLYLAMSSEALGRYDDAISQYHAYTALETFTGHHDDAERRLGVLVRERDALWARQRIAEEDSLAPLPPHSYPVAVFRFGLSDPNGRIDGLGDALTAQLSVDLSRVRRLDLLESDRLDALQTALPLGGIVDSTTAPRMGRLAGARYCVTGQAVALPDDRLRIEARVLETESGVSTPVRGEARLEDFFAFQKTLVFELLDAMGIVPTDRERAAIAPYATRSLPAYLSYGQGMADERIGDDGDALHAYREARRLDPGFAAAATAAARLSGVGGEVPSIAAFIQAVGPPEDFRGFGTSALDEIVPDRQRMTENEAMNDIEDRPDDFRVPPQAPVQIPDPPAPPGG